MLINKLMIVTSILLLALGAAYAVTFYFPSKADPDMFIGVTESDFENINKNYN